MPPPPGEDRSEPSAGQHHRPASTTDAEGGEVEATADEERGQSEVTDEERQRFEEFKREVFGPRCC